MQRVSFHFQSGGYMTDDSAQRYETQVEVLFNGYWLRVFLID